MASHISAQPASTNVLHFFAERPALTAASVACYIATVVWLMYAIALQVRLESWVARVAMTAVNPALVNAATAEIAAECSRTPGIGHGLCGVDVRRAQNLTGKTRSAVRKLRTAVAAIESIAEESLEPSVMPLLQSGSVLEWVASDYIASADRGRLPARVQAFASYR